MTRLYPKTIYVPKTCLVPIEHCGPKCGFWCAAGPRCNQSRTGGGLKMIPEAMPESGFPEFCHLQASDVPGELFEVAP